MTKTLYTKNHCHRSVHKAIKTGQLVRMPCEVCGSKAEAHHPDYSKPLNVMWLCRKHHSEWHKENGFPESKVIRKPMKLFLQYKRDEIMEELRDEGWSEEDIKSIFKLDV